MIEWKIKKNTCVVKNMRLLNKQYKGMKIDLVRFNYHYII